MSSHIILLKYMFVGRNRMSDGGRDCAFLYHELYLD